MIEATLSAVGRLFVTVTVFAVLDVPTDSFPKERLAGETFACTTPVPVSDTVCGLLLALSVTVRVPVSVPSTAGVNATLIVHFAPAAKDVPQVFVCEKSPEVLIEEMGRATVSPFLSVTFFVLLVVEIA